jgi:hypothetical protein
MLRNGALLTISETAYCIVGSTVPPLMDCGASPGAASVPIIVPVVIPIVMVPMMPLAPMILLGPTVTAVAPVLVIRPVFLVSGVNVNAKSFVCF